MRALNRIILIIFCLILFSPSIIHAAAPTRVSVYLKPDITVKMGEQVKSFYDANGELVFPIIYQGTTYLPVRAVSALMGKNIEWDAKSKTVYIGRTLSAPGLAPQSQSAGAVRDGGLPAVSRPSVRTVEAAIMKDVLIMYDFEVQNLFDANGSLVYPINYQGSNYLPLRAAARLMGENIEWDAGQKLITISKKDIQPLDETDVKKNGEVEKLNGFLAETVAVFDEATVKIVGLGDALALDGGVSLVSSISRDVQKINSMTEEIKSVNTDGFSPEELDAYEKLLAYADSAAYYVLISENIIYMAAEGQDYSMFAETFLTFAMDAQSKYEAARSALSGL